MNRPVALITGASSGIGAAFAERLAADGHDLILVARRRSRLEELAGRLKDVDVEVIAADLAEADMRRSVEARLADQPVTVLVNNAGFGGYRPFVELDPDVAERQIELHCVATVRLTRAALPGMIARGSGAVINVSSMLSLSGPMKMPHLHRANYAATKAFITTFTQILAHELEGTGVKVQALLPGLVRTEFHDDIGGTPKGIPAADAADVVAASLQALATGAVMSAPAVADADALERVAAAQRSLFSWRPPAGDGERQR
jgi:short-subunit dehydrogenase